MALTKLPRNAIGTGAIDNTKIEDGTIQAVELSGTLPETKLATSTIANAKLSNSTITINGTTISLGGSSSIGVELNWQTVKTAAFNAVAGEGYFVNTTSGVITVTLPTSASIGDQIAIKDYAGTFATNNLTIARNGHNIQGVANNSLISTNRASLVLVYVDATKGWLFTDEHNVADLQLNQFIEATGGTVATDGDFKIHSFTGDGCFVVSQLGAGTGPSNVDYLVVAGGGGGGTTLGGGGGAGGYRTTFPSPGCNAGSFPISATTYPITVGAGGPSGTGCSGPGPYSSPGSNSIFSTITSAGGGGGGNYNDPSAPIKAGSAGGSGGGGAGSNGQAGGTGGSGNTPPVSPSQGNTGGTGSGPTFGAGNGGAGGGGASAVGSNNPGPSAGGAGSTNLITGSPVIYAGGGGGAVYNGAGGAGGPGGGGTGGRCTPSVDATSGSENTGGGSGGNRSPSVKAGGSGIVIIRYKFQ